MLLKLGVGALVLATAVTVPAGVAMRQYGIVTVSVDQKAGEGPDLFIPVPLALVSFALNFIPRQELGEVERELAEFGPLASDILVALADCPDFTLVEVEDGPETVLISKENGRLVVRVKTPDESVSVKVPLWGAGQILNKVTRLAAI